MGFGFKGADRRSRSRELFHAEGTTVEKARDAKYEATAGFLRTDEQMMTGVV